MIGAQIAYELFEFLFGGLLLNKEVGDSILIDVGIDDIESSLDDRSQSA
jgi:hypothetical protein